MSPGRTESSLKCEGRTRIILTSENQMLRREKVNVEKEESEDKNVKQERNQATSQILKKWEILTIIIWSQKT